MADEMLVFDGAGLDELARDLRAAARDFRRETDRTLAKIGAELYALAKQIAGEHSSTVAGTIRLRALPGMIVISAGSDAVPIAALWELGNKGTHNSGRVQGVWFRHPVFGRDVWVNQRRYPFLRPAADYERKSIRKLMDATYDRVLEPYRMKPEGSL